MKPKTIYILMIICCMSLLSFAKQAHIACDKKAGGYKAKCIPVIKASAIKEADVDLRPLRILMFDI